MIQAIFDTIKEELDELARDPKNVKDYLMFYRDNKPHIFIVTPLVRKVAKENYNEVKKLDKQHIILLCEKLLNTRGTAYQDIAFI